MSGFLQQLQSLRSGPLIWLLADTVEDLRTCQGKVIFLPTAYGPVSLKRSPRHKNQPQEA